MTNTNEKIHQLSEKVELLKKRQEEFSREIVYLQLELNELKKSSQTPESQKAEEAPTINVDNTYLKELVKLEFGGTTNYQEEQVDKKGNPILSRLQESKSGFEKYIGENIINKIGIVITIFGVAIGTKYSIDNDLISPLTRIILGYLFGLSLLGFGIKLKNKYENFSAVLVSGAMSIMYFITYTAYGFYHLIPQSIAFILMMVFTVFTVLAAIKYDKQIIAHIGLVGAYALPFLLSGNSENAAILFTYMTIINSGILFISVKRYWKPLYHVSFGVTWLIFLAWFGTRYHSNDHFELALSFLSLFFIIFYITFLSYKLIKKERFVLSDVVLLLINSYVFYGVGYQIFDADNTFKWFLGLFTLCNAVLHFVVSIIIYRQKLADKNIQNFISGLVIIFLTISIPVQLDGNWVTLLWTGEAVLLFWLGRTRGVSFFEKLSYPFMLLALFSLIHNWSSFYNIYETEDRTKSLVPVFNIGFLTSLCFILAFGFIYFISQKSKYRSTAHLNFEGKNVLSFFVPAILLVVGYFSIRLEIANYWNQLHAASVLKIYDNINETNKTILNGDLIRFRNIWIGNFSFLFVSMLAYINFKKDQNLYLCMVLSGFVILFILNFLLKGLYDLSELRESYLDQVNGAYYSRNSINLWLRYVSYIFVGLALNSLYSHLKQGFDQKLFKIGFDLLLLITILWIASSELINWMNIFKSDQSYKLGLSILWGTYSLVLVVLGIWKKNRPIRLAAFVIFAATLLKLFFYDISSLNTLAKTIVFVSLGILLLIISFLYNKYKYLISEDETNI